MSEAHDSTDAGRTDAGRRDEILRLTLTGLEEDLDELRSELGRQLSDYEGRLRKASESLPNWLEIPPQNLRALFRLPSDGEFEGGMLGPRAVALAAARVEGFIGEWVGQRGEIASHDFDEERVESYREDIDRLEEVLSELEDEARSVAGEADTTLGDWLDDIVTELEDRREADEAALRELVSEGEVGKGRDARAEIADLWEEQRRKGMEIRAAWEPLEELVFEGVERTVAGIEDLRGLVERAREGLRGAHSALADRFEEEEAAREEDSEDAESHEVDLASDTVPGGTPYTGGDDDDSAGPGAEVDDAARVTEALEVAADEPGGTEPYIETGEEPEVASTEDAPSQDRKQGEEVEQGEKVEQGEEVDQPGDTEVDDVGDTVTDQAAETAPMDISPEDLDEAFGVDSEVIEEERVEEGDVDEGDVDEGIVDEEDVQEAEVEEEADVAGEEVSAAQVGSATSYEGTAVRIVSGWDRISGLERTLILAPPLLVFTLFVLMAAADQLDIGTISSPFRLWPVWGPRVFGAAAGWLLLVPLFRGWRPVWDGLRIGFVRFSDIAEEHEVIVDDAGFRLGSIRYPWSDVDAHLYRWELPEDAAYGWLLELFPRHGDSVAFVAPERNLTQWEQSGEQLVELPDDVWQINPTVFRKMRDRLPVT